MTYLPLRRMVRKLVLNEKIRLRSLPRSFARTGVEILHNICGTQPQMSHRGRAFHNCNQSVC